MIELTPEKIITTIKNKKTGEVYETEEALKAANIEAIPINLFEAINGFTISISPAEAERLETIPTIRSIEAVRPIFVGR